MSKKKLKRPIGIICSLILLPLLLLIGTSCKKTFETYYSNTGAAPMYLYDKLKQDTNFSMFADGLQRLGLVNQVNSGGLFTVFAPVNNAFRSYLASKGYATMNDIPTDTLFQIVNYHITNNLWYYYTLQQRYLTGRNVLYLTRGGKFLQIDVTAQDTLKVNNVPVIKSLRDITADNAVIHGIGQVLAAKINLESLLSVDNYFKNSTFYQLMQVMADSAYDRFNSYDKNRDGAVDSVFYKTYSLLTNVYTSVEYVQNTVSSDQGGTPVFTTIMMPVNDSLNAFIAPALAKVGNKISALSPTYAQAVLSPYFLHGDTAGAFTATKFINKPSYATYLATNGQVVPNLTAASFYRTDAAASNGMVQVINLNFPPSDRLQSALGQASTDPDLSMFMQAMQTAGLMSTYEATGQTATIFAPTNAAFIAAKLDPKKMTMDGVNLTATQFSNMMKNHLLPQSSPTSASFVGSITTVFANTNTLTFTNSGANVTTTLGLTANITLPYAYKGPNTNSYVYKVDKILVPFQ